MLRSSYDVDAVRTLPPILYPGKILNAAVNFYSHVNESGTPEEQAAARRQRLEERGVPHLFLKPGRGAVIGNGHEIVIPYGRDRTDWEVELGAVIGRAAKYVDANDAQDYVFGYMVSGPPASRARSPIGRHSRCTRRPGAQPALYTGVFICTGRSSCSTPRQPWAASPPAP